MRCRIPPALRSAGIAAALCVTAAVAATSAAFPAFAEDRIIPDDGPGAADDTGGIMNRALPFRDGQRLRYFSHDGTYEGYAERHRLTIWFYDADGKFLGRAQRVSQARTDYFTPDGTYVGRRYHQKMTIHTVRNRDD